MSVSGLCEVCQSKEATERCQRCGTLACSEHFDRTLGVCAECAVETGQGRGDGRPGTNDDFDAGDTYQF